MWRRGGREEKEQEGEGERTEEERERGREKERYGENLKIEFVFQGYTVYDNI